MQLAAEAVASFVKVLIGPHPLRDFLAHLAMHPGKADADIRVVIDGGSTSLLEHREAPDEVVITGHEGFHLDGLEGGGCVNVLGGVAGGGLPSNAVEP